MKNKTALRMACIAAFATVLVAGCSSSNSPKVTNTNPNATITVNGIVFPKPELSSVTIGESAIDIGSMPIYNIEDEHLDQQFGMKVNVKTFNGDAPAVQALVAGQIDVDDSSAGMFTTQVTGKPAKSVFLIESFVSDILFTQGSIKSAGDLKGKSIAVSSLGSYSYAEALLSIESLGLKPSDVTLTPVGHDSDRLAALKSGSVAGAILDTTLKTELTGAGFNALVDLGAVNTPGYTGLALVVPNSFAQRYPNTTLALVAMYQWGLHDFLNGDQARNAATWAKYSGEKLDQATADVKTELGVTWKPIDGRCEPDTFTFQKSVLVTTNPGIKSIDPATVCTDQFTDKLKQLGFQKKLGVQGY